MTLDGKDPRSWFRENSTLIYFLIGQLIAIGAAGSSIIAYMVRLETRVSIIETRGSEHTMQELEGIKGRVTDAEQNLKKDQGAVDRVYTMQDRITVLEQRIDKNEESIKRLVEQFLKDKANRP